MTQSKTSQSSKFVLIAAVALAGLALAYLAKRPDSASTGSSQAEAAPVGAADGNTVNASVKVAPGADRFAGEWEQTNGTATVVCNGKVAKEQPLAGKRFKLTRSAEGLKFSDDACEFPLAVEGTHAKATSDHCVPANPESPIITISKQSIESADGKLATVVFEGNFHVDMPDVNKQMDCNVTVNGSARRL
ncbi:MAG TPA: hypothetical protein VM686_05885 [Polyangiaceae bacterium]|jgi:hypothetical protein|nr:hypothetical protein [Polyangiaceae bacterium]